MEAPLNACEFLKRFHLPQLVRISQDGEGSCKLACADKEASVEAANCARMPGEPVFDADWSGPPESLSASQNLSDHARLTQQQQQQQQHEKSEWTYKPAMRQPGDKRQSTSVLPMREKARQEELRFWTGREVRRSVDFETSNDVGPPVNGSASLPVESIKQANEEEARLRREESIRLAPPSRRPALSKLQLNQPFLLYKAFKKLELCAYVIDLKNELNEKSGDPIYFPQNYPGWFAIVNHNRNEPSRNHQPLDSIDQVCRTEAQIFVTRDELLAYQLPSKLSHLTKLKNNQLLALPLAINLDKLSPSQIISGKASSNQQQKQKDQGKQGSPVSDIRQVVISCNQVLKICGVYEDVLPLIEGGSKQCQSEFKHRSDMPSYHYDAHRSVQHYQMAPQAGVFYQQMAAQQQQQNLFKATDSYNQINQHSQHSQQQQQEPTKLHKLLKLRYTNEPQQRLVNGRRVMQNAGVDPYALAPPLIYGGPQQGACSAPNQLPSVTNRQVGQRYARCVLLNQRSVDKLCFNQAAAGSSEQTPDDDEDEQEAEVLIPIEQRGRFYLCATNQSVINELYCRSCSNESSSYVYRLSQIISLLSLSNRLFSRVDNNKNTTAPYWNQQQQQQQHLVNGRCDIEPVSLPLMLRLISGPRPVNFSPSMFGSSSTMESYFRLESNIGGHTIKCKYNKMAPSSDSNNLQTKTPTSVTSPACDCAQSVKSGHKETNYGLFSAMLRIERLTKRDVLLACTIKPEPLLHLDLVGGGSQAEASSQPLCRKRNDARDMVGQFGADSRHANWISGTTRQLQSDRLMALRETTGFDQSDSHLKSLGKSSFSRLRACRSLISLNGRRNKKRPTIPNSMMTPGNGQFKLNDAPPGGASSRQADNMATGGSILSKNGPSVFGNSNSTTSSGHDDNRQTNLAAADSSIVMLEFDCRGSELKFVRTFVESSIPSSSIPDLVLSRMDFCHRNSQVWERQLKLSYRTLSRDFDSCQRQMEHNRRQAARLMAIPITPDLTETQIARVSQQQRLTFNAGLSNNLPSSSSDSTTSSRSSSGVSSGTGRDNNNNTKHHKRPSSSSGSQTTSSPSAGLANDIKSASSSNVLATTATNTSLSSGSASSTSHSASRLLRLVQRILPGRQLSEPDQLELAGEIMRKTTTTTTTGSEQERRQKVLDELSCKFRSELVVDCENGKVQLARAAARTEPIVGNQEHTVAAAAAAEQATLMNAQKIHRKLLKTNSVGLKQYQADGDFGPQVDCRGKNGSKLERQVVGQQLSTNSNEVEQRLRRREDNEDEDSSSHLYESLERLNECLKRGSVGRRKPRLDNCSSPVLGGGGGGGSSGGASRPPIVIFSKLGRSMELLAAGRRSGGNNAKRQLADQEGYDDSDDDDDEWWRSSTRESTSERLQRFGCRQDNEDRLERSSWRLRRPTCEKPPPPPPQSRHAGGRNVNGRSADRCRAAIGSRAPPLQHRPSSSGFAVGAWRHKSASFGNNNNNANANDNNIDDDDDYDDGRDCDAAMEPVSIEACHDEFVSMVEPMDEPPANLRTNDSDQPEQEERIYQNLIIRPSSSASMSAAKAIQRHQSSFELDRRRHLAGRMERKLMKLRNRIGFDGQHHGRGRRSDHLNGWLSDRELTSGESAPSYEPDDDHLIDEDELELRSINLPADQRPSRSSTAAAAAGGRKWALSGADSIALSDTCKLPRPTYVEERSSGGGGGGGRAKRRLGGSCSSESVNSFGSLGRRSAAAAAAMRHCKVVDKQAATYEDGAPNGLAKTATAGGGSLERHDGEDAGGNSLRSSSFASSSSCLSSSGSALDATTCSSGSQHNGSSSNNNNKVGVQQGTATLDTTDGRRAAWQSLAGELATKQIPFKAKLAAVGQVTGGQQASAGRLATLDRGCFDSGL